MPDMVHRLPRLPPTGKSRGAFSISSTTDRDPRTVSRPGRRAGRAIRARFPDACSTNSRDAAARSAGRARRCARSRAASISEPKAHVSSNARAADAARALRACLRSAAGLVLDRRSRPAVSGRMFFMTASPRPADAAAARVRARPSGSTAVLPGPLEAPRTFWQAAAPRGTPCGFVHVAKEELR
jgi:hypothetical protein